MAYDTLNLGRVYGDSAFEAWCKQQTPQLDPGLSESWTAFMAAIKGEKGNQGIPGADGLTEAQVDARVVAGITGKQDTLTFDADPVAESSNPVTSGGVFSALAGKQDALTFDSTPTEGSTNPVTSGGIHAKFEAASLGDTGWIDLSMGATVLSGGAKYRVKNGILWLCASYSRNTTQTAQITTTAIPAQYRPEIVFASATSVRLAGDLPGSVWYRPDVYLSFNTGLIVAGGVINFQTGASIANGTNYSTVIYLQGFPIRGAQ